MSESEARLLLSLSTEPGDSRLARALAECGNARALVASLREEQGAWPPAWLDGLQEAEVKAEQAVARARQHGLRWITPGDTQWPSQLADLDEVEPTGGVAGAPLGLWCRGEGDLGLLSEHAVGVVGARDCTTYGAEAAGDIAAASAEAGFTVVSGAAFGIDASAQRGGLAAGDAGVAVVACGADLDYPRAHASLLRRVAEGGVVVSEYAPGQRPARSRFLARNRLIAALVDGLVVVEAARRSGSLNTLHWADRLGRVTMAVPGPITSAQSQGTHEAMRSGKAVLVGSGTDVVAELLGFNGRVSKEGAPGLDPIAGAVVEALDTTRSRTPAALAGDLRLGTLHVVRALGRLEAGGLARLSRDGWVRCAALDRQ